MFELLPFDAISANTQNYSKLQFIILINFNPAQAFTVAKQLTYTGRVNK